MLERIVGIRDLGVFADCRPEGDDGRLERLTLLFAGNGAGKTTLSALLRSLGSGDLGPVEERARLAGGGAPAAEVRSDRGAHALDRSGWSSTRPGIEVFDDAFVARNVHSGLAVAIEHRRELHGVILGEEGVRLAEAFREVDGRLAETSARLRDVEKALRPAIRGGMDVASFCALPRIDDADEWIEEKERELVAVEQRESILRLVPVAVPETSPVDLDGLAAVLAAGIEGAEAGVEDRVRAHIRRLGDDGEAWLRAGVRHGRAAAPDCPFCGRDVEGSGLVESLGRYFSEEYARLVGGVERFAASFAERFGAEACRRARLVWTAAAERSGTLSRFAPVPEVAIDLERLENLSRAARQAVEGALLRKRGSLLRPAALEEAEIAAIRALNDEMRRAEPLAGRVEHLNALLEGLKDAVRAEAGSEAVRRELDELRNTGTRWSAEVREYADEWIGLADDKAALEEEKRAARRRLDRQLERLVGEYGDAVNRHLDAFGAGFRVSGFRSSYQGRMPQVRYGVVIRGEPVDASGATPGQVSFGTALSAGDRRALALAFFLARLDAAGNLGDRIVVLDDPVTGLDETRSRFVAGEAVRLAREAAQVLVLSHSPGFLGLVRELGAGLDRADLALRPGEAGVELRRWPPGGEPGAARAVPAR